MFHDRRFLLIPIALAHATAFLAIHSGRPAAPTSAMALSLYAVSGPEVPAAPAPPLELTPVETDVQPPALDPVSEEPLRVELAGRAAATAGDDCDLTSTVQQTLRSSAGVRAALSSLPQSDRSVANAVMLWDGRWIDGASTQADGALAQIRAVVAAVVRDASDACREQAQSGPRLIAISGAPDTVLALGSGRWRWGDLASP